MESLSYQLLVIDDTTHALLLVDGKQGEIIAEMPYPLEYTPTELRLSSDYSKAYMPVIGANGTGAIFVANLEQKSVYRLPIQLPPPAQFTLAPDDTCAYIADPNGRLYALTIPSMSLVSWGNPEEASCVGLAASSSAVYSVWEQDNQGFLAVFTPKGELVQEFPIPGIPTNIILDDAGHTILIPFTSTAFTLEGIIVFKPTEANESNPSTLISDTCLYPQDKSSSPAYPCHVATSSKEQVAYIVNEESGSITVIDIQSATITRHIKLGRSISCLHLLPSSNLAIATSHIFADLSMIDLANGRLSSTTNTERQLLGYIAVIPLSISE